jgi:hypothetical protein
MKRIFILLFVLPIMSMTIETDNSLFIGNWIGNDKGSIGKMTFDKAGFAWLEINGELIGGKESELGGTKRSLTYEINSQVDPIEVDLIKTDLESGKESRMLCIVRFIDNNTMEFASNFGGNRPKEFNPENSIILKRQE